MRKLLSTSVAVAFGVLLLSGPALAQEETSPSSPRPPGTDWKVTPSFKFDVLCLLNLLTGDSFYLTYYQKDYDELSPRLTPAARQALTNLKRKIKDERGNIISAFLTLYFSATDDQTLADLLKTVDDSGTMQQNLKKTPYYSDESWQLYESVRGDLRVIFGFLRDIQFERYWQENIRPKLAVKIGQIEPQLPRYDVVREVVGRLGFPLPSNRITVYMLYYSQPHGIKITGTRFLTDVAWPFRIVLRNAVHEMMHPPFNRGADAELRVALNRLQDDPFLMDKVKNHNPAFGYNSFDGFIEEDCVQALDQHITEKWGLAPDPRERWKENDDGMHVLAVALYSLMKEEGFGDGRESLRDFLIRVIGSGKLSPGRIKPLYEAFYAPGASGP